MISDMLNLHPRVLSLSELFSFVGSAPSLRRSLSAERMWKLCSRQRARTRLMLRGDFEELIYPLDDPNARFSRDDVPPIMCATLPHLTDDYEALFDELGPAILGAGRRTQAAHFRHLCEWLCERLDREVWVERSGGSLLFGARRLRQFPDARVIHIFRDGRETAISMSRHYLFSMMLATMRRLESFGLNAMAAMSGGKLWDAAAPWLDLVVSNFMNPSKLPYDELTLADFGTFWSGMIERSRRMFGHFPPDRLLEIRFEEVLANPESETRRLIRFIDPSLEDEAWVSEASGLPRPTSSKFDLLPESDRAALDEACRPGMELLGYPIS